MKKIVSILMSCGLAFLAADASAQAPMRRYSVHELLQAAPIPEGTEIELHALVYQGEHAVIMLDEDCADYCDDVLGLDFPDEAEAGFEAARKRVGSAFGCCGKRKAYFDMVVTTTFGSHPLPPGSDDSRPVIRVSQVHLIRVISAKSDTPSHWLAVHK